MERRALGIGAALFARPRERVAFWKGVPPWARALFLGGVFTTFSVVGFANDVFSLGANPPGRLAIMVGSSGLIAVLYAACAVRSARLIPVAVLAHVGLTVLLNVYLPAREIPPALDASALLVLRQRLTVDGIGIILVVVGSYVCFVTFISTEGQRYLRVQTEMVLAERIHRSLVPIVDRVAGPFEFCGRSFPSGEVGGDLVDVIVGGEGERSWFAIVADVSGHGVSSGVLTAMVKSAVRMRLRAAGGADDVLTDLNETLVPVTEPNMFVTCACLDLDARGCLSLASAGHPPALHYRAATGDVVEHNTSNLALGIMGGQGYGRAALEMAPGDVVVLLTDGLFEVFDRRDEEFGLEGVSAILRANARQPLKLLAERIRAGALAHGAQADDQTLLLVRRNGAEN
jgi:hypothetical protein